jgi:hypothetical protein
MALDASNIDIPLTGGLNESADPRVLPPGSYTTLVNWYPAQGGILECRSGYGELGPDTQGGDTVPTIRRLGQRRGELYGIGVDTAAPYLPTLYSYVSSGDTWQAARGYVSNAVVQRTPLYRGAVGAKNPWVVATTTSLIYVWEWGGVAIVARVVDIATGAVRMADAAVSNTAKTCKRPSVALVGNYVYVAYYNDTDVRVEAVRIDVTDGQEVTVSSSTSLVAANVRFDICAASTTHWILAYYDSAVPAVRVKRYSNWGVVDNVTSDTVNGPIWGVAVEHVGTRTAIVYHDSDGGTGYLVRAQMWGSNLGGIVYSSTTVMTHATLSSQQPLGLALTSSGTVCVAVYWPDGSDDYALTTVRLDVAGAQIGNTQRSYACSLVGRPFFHGGQAYAWAAGGVLVALDRTVSVSGSPGIDIVAYAGPDVHSPSGFYSDSYQLPRCVPYGGTSVMLGALLADISGSTTNYSGVDVVNVNLSAANVSSAVYGNGVFPDWTSLRVNPWPGVECQGGVLIPGAVTSWYDGQTVTECGLSQSTVIDLTLANEANALDDDGGSDAVYQYVVVHERADAAGVVHRSRVSDVRSVTVAGGSASQKCTVQVQYVAHTNTPTRASQIALFRTKKNAPDGPFYRLTPTTGSYSDVITNSRTAYSTTFVDTNSDTELEDLGYGFLYTDGGILDSHFPPPSRMALSAKSRAWLLSAADEREVWYSRAYVEGEAPCFHPALTVRVPDGAEPLTAIAALDDKIVLFGERQIWVISGDGPNDQGLGGAFSDPIQIQSDAGCVVPGSVITTPAGVLFQSSRGLHILDSGLNVSFAGAAAQQTSRGNAFAGFSSTLALTQAHVDSFRKRVRWLGGWDAANGATGNVTVFDYGMGQWYTEHFDNAPTAIGTWGKRLVLADASNGVGLESHGTYPALDMGSGAEGETFVVVFPDRTLITPWIHFGGIAGFQRAKRLLIVGLANDDCTLRVRVYVDHSDTAVQDKSWTLDGTDASTPNIRLNLHLARQKCSSMRIRIDVTDAGLNGDVNPSGVRLLGLSLIAGVKAGAHKVPAEDKG